MLLLLLVISLWAATGTATHAAVSWPVRYSSPIFYQDFFGNYNATAFFDFAAQVERFDFRNDTAGEMVSHYYLYEKQIQVVVSYPSGQCYWLPLLSFKTIPRSPLPLELAIFDGYQIDFYSGKNVSSFLVPIYNNNTFVNYHADAESGLPVLIGGGALNIHFLNVTADFSDDVFVPPVSNITAMCLGPYPAQSGTVSGTNLKFTADAYNKLDPLLFPRAVGSQGGDGGQTTALPGNRTYVVNDDQMIGIRLHGQRMGFYGIVNNMVVIVNNSNTPNPDSADVLFYSGPQYRDDGTPSNFFQFPNAPFGGPSLWSSGGIVANNTMYLVVEATGDGAPANWMQIIVSDVHLSPPHWSYKLYPTPFNGDKLGLSFEASGSILMGRNGDTFVYVFGFIVGFLTRKFQLARVPFAEFSVGDFSSAQYYSSWVGWTSHAFEASTLFESDAECSTVFYHEGTGLYIALTTSGGEYVGIAVAKQIQGPYKEQRQVYRIPPVLSNGYLAYCPAAHQMWSPSPSSIVLTYFVNNFGGDIRAQTSSNSYKASFVKIDLSGKFEK